MNQPARGLRILFHHRIAASDGMRVHIFELVRALREAGHVVEVVGPAWSEGQQQAGASTRLERLAEILRRRLPAAVYELLELLYNVPAYFRLRAAARAFRPDVLYERYNLFLLAGLVLKRRLGLPMLLEINSPLASEREALGQLQLTGLGRRCEAALWRGADVALPVTEVLAGLVRRVRREGAVEVMPNGANLARRPAAPAAASVRLRLGLERGAVVLGFVGFVRAWHGVGWAIEALPRLAGRVHLVIVGDGDAGPELRARAEALGVADRVHLVGRVPHEEVPAYMQTFDVALQTAATPYASPLKLFEYMGLARAVLAPDQPNLREVLVDGRNALLFRPGDRESFTAALVRLCENPDLRVRLGSAALRTICETPFTWTHNAARLARLAVRLSPSLQRGGDGPARASAADARP